MRKSVDTCVRLLGNSSTESSNTDYCAATEENVSGVFISCTKRTNLNLSFKFVRFVQEMKTPLTFFQLPHRAVELTALLLSALPQSD